MLELIENAKATIDSLMNQAGARFVEQLLVLSAQEVAGDKHPGRRLGEVLWHGSQAGQIVLAGEAACAEAGRGFAAEAVAARKWPSRSTSGCRPRRGWARA